MYLIWPNVVNLAALLLLVLVGCKHSDRGKVSGTLVHKGGSPLVEARLIGRSDNGKSVYSTTDANGKFELGIEQQGDGVPAGQYQLMVMEDRGDADHPKPQSISAKYNNASSSGLSIKVEPGGSEKLDLKLDGPP